MIRTLAVSLSGACAVLGVCLLAGGYPKPNPYPLSWELKFEHGHPRRLLITPRGSDQPQAYWYMTFTVTNEGRDDVKFLPVFEMLTEDGRVLRSDDNVPPIVLETIRLREKSRHLMSITDIAGPLRVGPDQAKDGVAIWREPASEMGQFSIFVKGLSGEATILKDEKGQDVTQPGPDGKPAPVVLWKTLALHYHVAGDDRAPGHDVCELVGQEWIMR